ncbi:T9SS type B sorting domain-containing protein [Winogradskyella thalassocola]|uniref:Gliding motility-associated C-terminal domain-containing protein n=1 Tax=Winogradskyella thalassocola TaxID=262004 RepID=A0A1G8FV00_9FLAO|nr:T9SS type B sorting domain-containing protein [Winogradskyella thalassocola]SDH85968.1 gliding motility-associated C-terminal domain-containing protein [Winogradskyella thalassocola]
MPKPLQFILFGILCFVYNVQSFAQITLTHNVGTTPIATDMFSCERDESWSKIFVLEDFGISPNEQFKITSGQVALSQSNDGALLQFNVYSIDANFPVFFYSLYPPVVLGSRGIGQSPIINGTPEIINVEFDEPIIVPAGVERILVTVQKHDDFYNPASSQVFIAGTAEDTGESWYEGCDENYGLTQTTDLVNPVPDANFYINVTGETIDIQSTGSTTRLSHNGCDDIIKTDIHSCSSSYIYWARTFDLDEFGISTDEEYVINSGQVGINNVGWLPEISFNIYEIDDNFPDSFSTSNLIGSSQYQELSPAIGDSPQIVEVVFDTPIVIPAGVEKILVEVHKGIEYGSGLAFIAGSTQSSELSWQRGCTNFGGGPAGNNQYVSTASFGRPNANFYINVTGDVNHTSNTLSMNISNICSEFLKEFSIEEASNVASVQWDFGDVASGTNNTSVDLYPFHDFSADGTFTVSATVTTTSGTIEVITETINVIEPPTAYGINNIYACEDSFGTGLSSSIDISTITAQVLGGQTNRIVTFVDGSGAEHNTLPNPFSNTVRDLETIKVRVSNQGSLCCYSETSFDIIVTAAPEINTIADLFFCDDDSDGFTTFDLSNIPSDLINGQPNLNVELIDSNNATILPSDYSNYTNLTSNEDKITARVTSTTTNCVSDSVINLSVNINPVANDIQNVLGCDDNNDGISEYFDTSTIDSQLLNGQSGLSISYFDENNNQLPSPLPNPFTNTSPFNQTITARVTNTSSTCYDETTFQLQTITQPHINHPGNLYACDQGDGYSEFDTSSIEQAIIGNQTGLVISYYDANGSPLPSPLPSTFENTEPFSQTINVKVEDASNPICYSETSFNLIVNPLPEVNLDDDYTICYLEPSLSLSVDTGFYTYAWYFENGTLLSSTRHVTIENEGTYTLSITQLENNMECEQSFSFRLTRSMSIAIEDVNYGELGHNFIEIIASGDGDFEYSIDGIHYQNSNFFSDVKGGVYEVYVRDKNDCGEASKEVIIIDYPKFFTPNNDGDNDFWRIDGINKFPNSNILIYDRYGKLVKQLSANDFGWDGFYNGTEMVPNDYWFTANLGNGKTFEGHFSLKR